MRNKIFHKFIFISVSLAVFLGLFSNASFTEAIIKKIKRIEQPSSITVTSPNGGEQLVLGEIYDITWDFDSEEEVIYTAGSIEIYNGEEKVYTIGSVIGTASSGKHSFKVPTSFSVSNQYKIKVGIWKVGQTYDEGIFDESNNYFSIISAIACSALQNQTICLDNSNCYWDQQYDNCRAYDSTKQTCSDPDNGKDIYTQAHTYGFRASYASERDKRIRTGGRDACIGDKLRERYCSNDYYIKSYDVECPNGYSCENGACIVIDTNTENMKDLSQYSDKMSFLISDANWRDVLSLVPIAIWTNEDNSISKYPALIYHREDNAFDADSTIHFFQQYTPSKVIIVDDSPEDLDNLLIAEPELGAGLNQNQITRIYPEHYLNYWESYYDIVYVEDDYQLALMASTFASLINAPLIIKGYNDYIDFSGHNVICIGNPNADVICNENYSLEQLQREYKDLTETQKVILTDYTDLDKYISGNFTPDKSSSISKLFSKMSLSSPFLAAGKQELIIPIQGSKDHIAVDEQFTNEFLKFFETFGDSQECKSNESCAQGFNTVEHEFNVAENEVIFHFDLTEEYLTAPSGNPYDYYKLIFYSFSIDCGDNRDTKFEVYFNGERYGQLYSPCISVNKDVLVGNMDILMNVPSSYFSPGPLDIKLVAKEKATVVVNKLLIMGKTLTENWWRGVKTCDSLDCMSGAYPEIIENIEASQEVSFGFEEIKPEQEHVLELSVAGYNIDGIEVWINDEKIDYMDNIYINNYVRRVNINKNLLNKETEIILKPIPTIPDSDMILKIGYSKLFSINPDNFFLTIVSAPNAVPMDLGEEEADIQYYSDIENDGYIDLYTGRIFGVTVSDASSYIARSLFFKDLIKNKDALVDIIGIDAGSTEENMRERLYSFGWGDIESQFDNIASCFGWDCIERKNELREFYDDVSLIIFDDHGSSRQFYGLLHSSYLDSNDVYLNSSTILESACLTCNVEYFLPADVFCVQNIRRGAMAYNGAISEAGGNDVDFEQLFKVFSKSISIGKAFNRERNSVRTYFERRWVLLADPTFKPKWW